MRQAAEDSKLIKTLAIIGDFILLNFSMTLIYFFFNQYDPASIQGIRLQTYLTIANLCYIPCISIFKVVLHNRIVRPEKIVGRVIYTVGAHLVLFITILGLMKISNLSRTFFFTYYISFFILICTWRLLFRYYITQFRKKGRNTRSAIIIGSDSNAIEIYHEIVDNAAYGYRVHGFFYDEENNNLFPDSPHLGEVKEVIPALKKQYVNEVFCCLPSSRQKEILEITDYCENNMIRFYSVLNIRSYLKRKMKMELFGEVPVLYIRDEPLLQPENKAMKRAFDFVCSTLFLCTLYPLIYIIVGSIIKITSPGPIYFKQERTGENGEIFNCLKFRSMKVNKDSDRLQATANDPRKTKFGNFLRKSNIDELPQFINVWKGEMSMVGPRPHMLMHTDMYSKLINKFMIRHLVKPGITGWAQITGFRGETKELSQMEGRVRKDIWYIENWSFLLDLRIMIKTFTNIIRGDKNAY